MRAVRFLCYFSLSLLFACATTPPPSPEVTEISLVSIEPSFAYETIIGSGDFSEEFEVPGFLIRFKSTKKIEDARSNTNSFWGVDYFICESTKAETDIGLYSTRNYKRIQFVTYETQYMMQSDEGSHLYHYRIAQDAVDNVARFHKDSQICMSIYIPYEEKYKKTTQARIISNHLPIGLPDK